MTDLPVLLGEDEIRARVEELAAQIDQDYSGVESLVLVGVLKGAFIFLADLSRLLHVPRRIEFLSVTSYGSAESRQADSVRLIMDLRHDIRDEHVLLVEDIVDTGNTLAYLQRILQARAPASLRTCSLLHKPDRTRTKVDLDYLGFAIPDVWVVGYGLDYAERHRTLPYIAQLPAE